MQGALATLSIFSNVCPFCNNKNVQKKSCFCFTAYFVGKMNELDFVQRREVMEWCQTHWVPLSKHDYKSMKDHLSSEFYRRSKHMVTTQVVCNKCGAGNSATCSCARDKWVKEKMNSFVSMLNAEEQPVPPVHTVMDKMPFVFPDDHHKSTDLFGQELRSIVVSKKREREQETVPKPDLYTNEKDQTSLFDAFKDMLRTAAGKEETGASFVVLNKYGRPMDVLEVRPNVGGLRHPVWNKFCSWFGQHYVSVFDSRKVTEMTKETMAYLADVWNKTHPSVQCAFLDGQYLQFLWE